MQKCDYFSENKFGDVWQGKIKEIANKIEGLKGEFMSKIDGNQQVNSDKLNNIDRFKEEVLNNLRVIRDENTVRIEKLERDIQEMGAMMNERLYMIMLNLTPPSNPGNFEPYGMPIAIEPQGIHQIIERPDY